MLHAKPGYVSDLAKQRQREEMGTLGSGNHYLEVQEVTEIFDAVDRRRPSASQQGDIVVMIHCGSRGLGHQIGTEYLRLMAESAPALRHRCCPTASWPARRSARNWASSTSARCARRSTARWPTGRSSRTWCARSSRRSARRRRLPLLYDVSHNTCKVEEHRVDGELRELFVHRKGATRAFGPGHPDLPESLRLAGQPVLIGGSMGTGSYVLAGTQQSESLAFSSACHGAGRAMSRHQALKTLAGPPGGGRPGRAGILVRSPSSRGVAEEAPGAYKDVAAVVDAADAGRAGAQGGAAASR